MYYVSSFFLFLEQGETFDVPEVVPFRLTQNMIHAMVSNTFCKISL